MLFRFSCEGLSSERFWPILTLKVFAVDTSLLPEGSVVLDGSPPGHVSVFASPDQIRAALVADFEGNPLVDLKQMDDGSYKLPKK